MEKLISKYFPAEFKERQKIHLEEMAEFSKWVFLSPPVPLCLLQVTTAVKIAPVPHTSPSPCCLTHWLTVTSIWHTDLLANISHGIKCHWRATSLFFLCLWMTSLSQSGHSMRFEWAKLVRPVLRYLVVWLSLDVFRDTKTPFEGAGSLRYRFWNLTFL